MVAKRSVNQHVVYLLLYHIPQFFSYDRLYVFLINVHSKYHNTGIGKVPGIINQNAIRDLSVANDRFTHGLLNSDYLLCLSYRKFFRAKCTDSPILSIRCWVTYLHSVRESCPICNNPFDFFLSRTSSAHICSPPRGRAICAQLAKKGKHSAQRVRVYVRLFCLPSDKHHGAFTRLYGRHSIIHVDNVNINTQTHTHR